MVRCRHGVAGMDAGCAVDWALARGSAASWVGSGGVCVWVGGGWVKVSSDVFNPCL